MCTTCGCASGETRIEGQAVAHDPLHHHEHTHGDGTRHSHPHDHRHEHGHGAGHEHHHHGHDPGHSHGAADEHWHQHEDGTWHSHSHDDHAHAHHDEAPGGRADLDYGAGAARAHAPGMTQARMVQIEQDILARNNQYAAQNRQRLFDAAILALNLVSSPGSGKTTLLTRTLEALKAELPLAVIEGDQETAFDAERIRATGVPALQINTGKGCHLDAHMVGHALEKLPLPEGGVLFIENVGNLVCPAAFDLGEAAKVAILSVTEGADKPLKYPDMFHAARLLLINKSDLLPYVQFDVDQAIAYARRVNPRLEVLTLSATTGEGFDAWLDWLRQRLAEVKGARIRQLEAELAKLKGA
ncbi:hydrogenase nickel incorporation protein HypB [Azovibrio restrictus]|uniref:hydrogenase nickel incorporation protein HypB n=1 Tax=Azovibrio restrictus TaxID=146938 RepID=UPI0026EC09B5|nr:hydrogenase nickel incorporation protein HypB [Azovibrio restrictus]